MYKLEIDLEIDLVLSLWGEKKEKKKKAEFCTRNMA